jgi:multicomponent Na+:H+ antiporter subunit A
MLIIILLGFLAATVAPWLNRFTRRATGWIVALLPLTFTVYFASLVEQISAGNPIHEFHTWVPSLGINLSFYVDGLSLLFALIISGIGTLVLIYAGGYLGDDDQVGRFFAGITFFMTAMLGLVVSGNLITLFIFWELTSVSSFILIGLKHRYADSRSAALQALLVTGVGGLALLAGFLLLGQTAGSFEINSLLRESGSIRSNSLYVPILFLILLGAFTKSAQVPFHFWLPNAMAAPTPVSAYLHSATMVKAGIYLLARLSPILGSTDTWQYAVTLAGATTMLLGAVLALFETDLKAILAYSTISALGTLTLLMGLDTTLSVKAAMVFLLVHALYKGALFLAAGAFDHETGTRDIRRLEGVGRYMPITTAALVLAAISMAGLPPMLGFIGKELLYEAKLGAPRAGLVITVAGVLANVLMVTIAGIIAVGPLLRGRVSTPKTPHRAPVSLWLGALLLAGLGLIVGLFPDQLAKSLISPAVSAARAQPTEVKLALWHGINPVLLLSIFTVLTGVVVFLLRRELDRFAPVVALAERWGPRRWYALGLDGLDRLSQLQTRLLQSGYLRLYLLTIILTTVLLTGYTLFDRVDLVESLEWPQDVRLYEVLVAGVILGATVVVARSRSRLAAVVALGAIGYGLALIYLMFGAPDLAMAQFAIETLTVILFVLVLYRLPRFATLTSQQERLRDVAVATVVGGFMTLLVLAATATPFRSLLTPYFAESSVPLAKGRNIVNVILVDFRGLDTLGEITVLAIAAIGVYALMKLRLGDLDESEEP